MASQCAGSFTAAAQACGPKTTPGARAGILSAGVGVATPVVGVGVGFVAGVPSRLAEGRMIASPVTSISVMATPTITVKRFCSKYFRAFISYLLSLSILSLGFKRTVTKEIHPV